MNGGDHVEVVEAAHMLRASRKGKSLWPYDLK